MKRICCPFALTMLLAGCSGLSQPTAQVSAAPKRELTPAEKLSFTPVLAAGLKDPSAAQFKWMPVVLTERDGITDYCGLVNGKNSYGGYTGFVRFYAQLQKDAKGQFITANLRALEPPNREPNFIESRWLNGICEQYGYEDFSVAK
jgi:PBP1b-binding outer membrane lipoprotein LpoB